LIGSCTRREIESLPTNGNVHISMNWDNLYKEDAKPSSMKLYFYGSKGTVIIKECSSDGFSGELPLETYKVLTYNTNASNVVYSGLESFEKASVTASSATKSTYISQPTDVYGVGIDNLSVSFDTLAKVSMKPLNLIKRAYVKINLSGNLSVVGSCHCTIDGFVGSARISTGDVSNDQNCTFFVASPSTDGYASTVTFFGRTPETKNDLTVTLNFIGGGSQQVNADITSGLDKLGPNITAVDLKMEVKISGSVESGYNATLKGWNIEERKMDMQ